MKTDKTIERFRKGDLLVEVEFEWLEEEHPWAPYLKPANALRLNDVKRALDVDDLDTVRRRGGRIFRIVPVNAA